MTPDTRHRAPLELLRFTAAPVSADVTVLELEGLVTHQSRFTRQPLLVVEEGEGRRLELAPVRAIRDGERWSAVYAVPLAALDGGTFALGLRGTLLDLPSPDLADEGDRLASVAREANRLRRRLDAAQAAAAAARAEAEAAAAELGAAVTAARDGSHAEAADRISALEHEVVAAHRQAAQDVEEARAEVAAAQEAAFAAAVIRADEAEGRAEAAEQRAEDAQARAGAAQEEARIAAAGIEVLRVELAEERERSQATIADLGAQLDEARSGAGDDPDGVVEPEPDPDPDPDPDPVADPTTPTVTPIADVPRPLMSPRTPASAPPHEALHRPPGPAPSRWVAVAALALFLFVLLGLLLGFLG